MDDLRGSLLVASALAGYGVLRTTGQFATASLTLAVSGAVLLLCRLIVFLLLRLLVPLRTVTLGERLAGWALWALVLLLLVGGASYLGALIERRVLGLPHLPIGIRVGVGKVVRVLLVLVAIMVALSAAGLDLTTLTVIGGAVGVGLGFASCVPAMRWCAIATAWIH